jgi:hypothetical protein
MWPPGGTDAPKANVFGGETGKSHPIFHQLCPFLRCHRNSISSLQATLCRQKNTFP